MQEREVIHALDNVNRKIMGNEYEQCIAYFFW